MIPRFISLRQDRSSRHGPRYHLAVAWCVALLGASCSRIESQRASALERMEAFDRLVLSQDFEAIQDLSAHHEESERKNESLFIEAVYQYYGPWKL